MTEELASILEALAIPSADQGRAPLFAVKPVPGYQTYFLGKDSNGKACLLVGTSDACGRVQPPIQLETLDAQFELGCRVTKPSGDSNEGRFTVVRCRSSEHETIRYFLSVCNIIIHHLGDAPSRSALASAIQRLVSIFQSMRRPPVRSLNGLFGELFLISRSRNPARAVAAWRTSNNARFDFSVGDIRLDVKTCAGRLRQHTFTFDQCNPPSGTQAVVASLMVEQVPNGTTLADLIVMIEYQVGVEDLLLKLHALVAATMGTSLASSLDVPFDHRVAESTLRFFDLRAIPAVRGKQSPGVSDVRFISNLSGCDPLAVSALIDRDPQFWDLLPTEKK